jgi:hypothetical protein
VFAGALTVGAVLRLLAVLGYPGALWFYGDSYIYLGAALRPQPDPQKTTGYSLFLRALLPLHSLTLVVVLQHLMGLADAVMIYALLRRAGVSKRWATVASLPMLLDGYVIEDEHLIMAEALFTFLLMVGVTIVLWRPRTSWWKALIAGLLLGFAVIVRTEGAVVLIIFPLFLLVRGWSWKTISGWVAAAAMCVGILVPVGAYVSWFHSRNGQYELTTSTGLFLWGRVSSFANCGRIKPTGAEAEVCPTQPIKDRKPPGNYIYHAPQVVKIPGGAYTAGNNSLLTSFAIHAIEAQPLDYAETVVKATLLPFGFPRIAYPRSGTTLYYSFHAQYKTATYDTLPPGANATGQNSWIPGGTALGDWLSFGRLQPGVVDKVFAYPLIAYTRVFYTWGPLLAVIFLLGLGGVISVRRRDWTARRAWDVRKVRLRWQVRGTSMLPWITAVALLVTPIAVADFDYRYLIPALPFACVAAGLAFAPSARRDGRDTAAQAASGGEAEQAVPGPVTR